MSRHPLDAVLDEVGGRPGALVVFDLDDTLRSVGPVLVTFDNTDVPSCVPRNLVPSGAVAGLPPRRTLRRLEADESLPAAAICRLQGKYKEL